MRSAVTPPAVSNWSFLKGRWGRGSWCLNLRCSLAGIVPLPDAPIFQVGPFFPLISQSPLEGVLGVLPFDFGTVRPGLLDLQVSMCCGPDFLSPDTLSRSCRTCGFLIDEPFFCPSLSRSCLRVFPPLVLSPPDRHFFFPFPLTLGFSLLSCLCQL